MSEPSYSFVFIDQKSQMLEISASIRTWFEDDRYYAECPELELIDQGETEEESIENLQEMILASLMGAIELNHIDEMLEAMGYAPVKIPVPDRMIYRKKSSQKKGLTRLKIEAPIKPLEKVTESVYRG